MTKIAYIADVHVGNHRRMGGKVYSGLNERCRMVLSSLRHAVAAAHRAKCDALVVCGDLFDDVRPSPQIITEVGEVFRGEFPGYTVVIVGNHDKNSDASGDHAIGPLAFSGAVLVTNGPVIASVGSNTHLISIPFRSGPAAEWLPEELERARKIYRSMRVSPRTVLALHLGISDETTPPYLKDAHDSISALQLFQLMEAHDIDAAFAGNWHFHRKWQLGDRSITQCGALAPTGFDNPGIDYGHLVIDDDGAITTRTITGPRFFAVEYGDEFIEDVADLDSGHQVFLTIKAKPEQLADAKAKIAELKLREAIYDGDTTLDKVEVKLTARSAAAAARSAENVEAAISQFVEHMQVDGCARTDVLARVQAYLAKSA